MKSAMFLPMRVASAFLLVFLWLILPHRYSKPKTLCIIGLSYGITGCLEFRISQHITHSIDMYGVGFILIEILVVLSTAMWMGEHRDSRAVFVGLSAATYSLAALMFGSLIYFYTYHGVAATASQLAFQIVVLWMLYRHNQKTPLTDLLADPNGRVKICLIPIICFVSVFVTGVYPGNIFTIPVCRPIEMVLLVLMFTYYWLVVVLLRTQLKSNWLHSNNEILEAYAHGLKLEIGRLKQSQEEIAIMRHDIRHRSNLVQYYLDAGNTQAIREMVENLNARLDATVEKNYCLDAAMNWVLSRAAQKASGEHVDFQCMAEIPELPDDLEFELGTVALNLLENAIAAAKELPEEKKRFVRVTARVVKEQLFLEMTNSYDGELRVSPETGLPLSDKGTGHGYGFRSVLAFAKKHQASYDFQGTLGEFHIRLLIPLR